ncbi:Anion transporter [Rhodovastum atsumiense]|uniref:Anion transporter n=1 Tax=Rhodovastum atsumiense TaxID=504468 RepID=A0A5M6ITR6_9PROT|nr:anion transporter [Rhodovastum atsumiense]KAA5611710.1 anion transporter [Rhodovastum atsumiense]CAH2604287.1 Anion transporter [Rhodovastum atsumiense]
MMETLQSLIRDHPSEIMAIAIFVLTYLAVAIGRVPGLHIDRAGMAFLGAALMVAAGVLPLDAAYRAIDWDTIALLLGMMLVVANLRLAGFFRLITAWAVRRAHHPLLLLGAIILVAGVLSAFLVNDTVCLVMAPLVVEVVLHLRRNPVPYVIAIPLASNAGSVATITGNPQNMIVGSLSQIPYLHFAAALAPVAVAGLVLTLVLVALVWWREFLRGGRLSAEPPPTYVHRALLIKALLVLAGLVAAFAAGVRPSLAALVAGAVLLPSRRVKVGKMYREVDWPLLLMFAGLFVVVTGLERSVLGSLDGAVPRLGTAPVLAGVTAVLSNLVSNVPAVLLLKPFVASSQDWLVVAMAATLAGNFTILGSVANLIVVQAARARGIEIGFWTYFKVGAPLSVLSILVGLALL